MRSTCGRCRDWADHSRPLDGLFARRCRDLAPENGHRLAPLAIIATCAPQGPIDQVRPGSSPPSEADVRLPEQVAPFPRQTFVSPRQIGSDIDGAQAGSQFLLEGVGGVEYPGPLGGLAVDVPERTFTDEGEPRLEQRGELRADDDADGGPTAFGAGQPFGGRRGQVKVGACRFILPGTEDEGGFVEEHVPEDGDRGRSDEEPGARGAVAVTRLVRRGGREQVGVIRQSRTPPRRLRPRTTQLSSRLTREKALDHEEPQSRRRSASAPGSERGLTLSFLPGVGLQ